MALVARKTCSRGCAALAIADQDLSMSSRLQRASAQIVGPLTSRATAATASQSPCDAAGNPASMMSTPSSASARATRSFSSSVMLQPGDCSPSRSVVSKILTRFGSGALISRYSIKGNPAATFIGAGFRIRDPSGVSPAAHALEVEGAAARPAAACGRKKRRLTAGMSWVGADCSGTMTAWRRCACQPRSSWSLRASYRTSTSW